MSLIEVSIKCTKMTA